MLVSPCSQLVPRDLYFLPDYLYIHRLPGTQCSAGLKSSSVTTVQGQALTLEVTSNGVKVNTAAVTEADVSVTNGVVHVIDTVLLPPGLVIPSKYACLSVFLSTCLHACSSNWQNICLPVYLPA